MEQLHWSKLIEKATHKNSGSIQDHKDKINKSIHLIFVPTSLLTIGEAAFSGFPVEAVVYAPSHKTVDAHHIGFLCQSFDSIDNVVAKTLENEKMRG